MFVKACQLPNGPLDLKHIVCITSPGHPAQAAGSSFLARHHEIPTIHMGVFGWVIFFFILAAALVFFCVNRLKEKRLRRQAWSVIWKLACAADQWREAYEEKANQLTEEHDHREKARDAILCGETMILDGGQVGNELADSCAKAMNMRMGLGNPPPWMDWNKRGNSAVFAVRSWGGLVWGRINRHVAEVISIGSCGLAAGAMMVNRMVELVQQGGFKYIVLKSLSDAESFWDSQDFVRLREEDSQGWWDRCEGPDRALLTRYCQKAGCLVPFGKRLEGAEGEVEDSLV